jgi:hypothetical protein
MRAREPTGLTLGEKTLVTWVYLDNLTDRAGSALTVEKQSGTIFDGVVYAEREDRKWVSGSNNYASRSRGSASTAERLQSLMVPIDFAAQSSARRLGSSVTCFPMSIR